MTPPKNQKGDIYQQIVEGLSSGVLMFNPDLQLEYLNPAGEMLLEASSQRLHGTNIAEILPQNEAFIDSVREAIDSGHPFSEREFVLNFPGPRATIVDVAVTPLTEGSKQNALLIELKPAEHLLRISKEENQFNQSQAIRALIRGLAHEVKNPLGGLRGAAQLLERELPEESLKEYTGIIIGEADRLRNLVNRMLGPNTMPQRVALNIHEVVEHVRQLMEAEVAATVSIEKDYDPSIPDLLADRDQLVQAILNIVRNATEAVGSNGVITLRTRALRQFTIGHKRHKLVCQLEIIDNGPGIPEDVVETIFFPMVSHRAEGTGLGLSIAQSLIQQHDGIILCNSQPGHTVFRVLIPISHNSNT